MKKTISISILSFMMIVLLVQSCAKDDSFENFEDDTAVEDEPIVSNQTTQIIVDWNELLLELDRFTTGMRPNATARSLAYIQLAAYETAVYNMTNYISNTNNLQGLDIDSQFRDDTINLNVALNTCYSQVINHFMYTVTIDKNGTINTLKEDIENTYLENLSEQVLISSRAWGNYVANRVIEYSLTDSQAENQLLDPQPFSYEPPVGEGFWTYSADAERAWFPYWETVRTFVISPSETSSIPPPITYSEDTSSDFYTEMNEVYIVSTTARIDDNEELWVSEFWSDDVEGLMLSPPGRQISIAKQLIEQHDLGYESSLVLLLKLGFSLNDAAVSTWADKYEYMVMRPNVYINEFIDEDYQTNLYKFIYWPNPSFPGYPSGHSTFASAAAGVFIDQFGNSTDFIDRTHDGRTEFKSTPRQFSSFSAMAAENAFSRVPFGVHVRMDCTEGLRLGYEISEAINSYNLSSN